MSHLGEIIGAYDGDDQEIRAMIERLSAIEEMVRSEGWQHYRDWLQNVVNAKSKKIILGNVESFDDYKRLAGYCQGIDFALDPLSPIRSMIEALIKPAEGPTFPWHEDEMMPRLEDEAVVPDE